MGLLEWGSKDNVSSHGTDGNPRSSSIGRVCSSSMDIRHDEFPGEVDEKLSSFNFFAGDIVGVELAV